MGWSSIAADAGLLLLACSLVLAIRSRTLSRACGSLARQLRLHHWLALVAMLLVLGHIGFELSSLGGFWGGFLLQLETWRDPGMAAGLAAALGLGLLLVFAHVTVLEQRPWLRIHRFGILVVALATLHGALFVSFSDTSSLPGWVVLSASTLSCGATWLALSWVPSQKRWRVASLVELGSGLFELELTPGTSGGGELAKGKMKAGFAAGSLAYARFLGPSFSRAWHPLSVASCRAEDHLRFIIRSCGRDTRQLGLLRPGDFVQVRGPFSHWRRENCASSEGEVWLAAGVGVAPFVGMLHCLPVMPLGQVCLVHFDRDESERVLIQKLCEGLCRQTCCSPQGAQVSVRAAFEGQSHGNEAQVIEGLAAEFPKARFVVCGPPKFVRLARKTLRHSGIGLGRIFD